MIFRSSKYFLQGFPSELKSYSWGGVNFETNTVEYSRKRHRIKKFKKINFQPKFEIPKIIKKCSKNVKNIKIWLLYIVFSGLKCQKNRIFPPFVF